jgi:hypothetical protein
VREHHELYHVRRDLMRGTTQHLHDDDPPLPQPLEAQPPSTLPNERYLLVVAETAEAIFAVADESLVT